MPSHIIHTQADLESSLAALTSADPRIADLLAVTGVPKLRRRPPGFSGLCAIICAQQLSTASANAIWGRLSASFDPFDHERVRRAPAARLVALGLSKPKIKALKAIGAAVGRGEINFDALADMQADAAHKMLTALHGIGPWTADIYLLFCLGHADAWPAGDLALQEAARRAFGLKRRPDAKVMLELAECWRPWRGTVAHLLWAYYHVIKRQPDLPVIPNITRTPMKRRSKAKRAGSARILPIKTNGGADGR
jgi:DNA-3-methyladenine glycosylase II